MGVYLARNQQWVWIASFKILAKPALIFWDNAGGDDSVNVAVPQRGTGAMVCRRRDSAVTAVWRCCGEMGLVGPHVFSVVHVGFPGTCEM